MKSFVLNCVKVFACLSLTMCIFQAVSTADIVIESETVLLGDGCPNNDAGTACKNGGAKCNKGLGSCWWDTVGGGDCKCG